MRTEYRVSHEVEGGRGESSGRLVSNVMVRGDVASANELLCDVPAAYLLYNTRS